MAVGILSLLFMVFAIGIIVVMFKSGSSGKKADTQNQQSKEKQIKKEDVFKFMEFDDIVDDMISQNGGKRFTIAIKAKGINYDLMSDAEQMAVEEGFITFLNTLKYPIQLYVQAQNIDLKGVIKDYRESIMNVYEEYTNLEKEVNSKSSLIDINREEIEQLEAEKSKVQNVYEYADDIINYVERMSMNKNLLQRNFYILVSYNTSDIVAADKFSQKELLEMCYTELMTRGKGIISALSSCSVEGVMLNTNELSDLLYGAYNRDDKSNISVREAIESGYYRLYSTSEDVFKRKKQQLEEEIELEARRKALDNIKKAIISEQYEDENKKELEKKVEVVNTATEMLKNDENMPADIKDKAYNYMLDDFRDEKRELIEKMKENEADQIEKIEKEDKELEEQLKDSLIYQIAEKREKARIEYEEEKKKEREEELALIRENSKNKNIEVDISNEEDDSII